MSIYNKNWSVVVDVDEVLNNLMTETIYHLKESFAIGDDELSLDDFTEYEVKKCVTPDVSSKMEELWADKSFWDNLIPAAGAVEAMRKLIQSGIEVFIMTACTPDIVEGRSKWFEKYFPFIKQENIIYGYPKWLVQCDFMVEDKFTTLMRTPVWTHRVLIDKPWNSNSTDRDMVHGIIRAKSITEAVDEIVKIVDDERNW